MPTAYEVLAVAEGASQDEVRRAVRRALADCHPDSGRGDDERRELVRRAAALVGEPGARAEYDARLRARRQGASRAPTRVRVDGDKVVRFVEALAKIAEALRRGGR